MSVIINELEVVVDRPTPTPSATSATAPQPPPQPPSPQDLVDIEARLEQMRFRLIAH